MHVSANVPVKEFWSFTVYDMATSALFRNSDRLVVSSLSKDLQKNPDGSVDIYFGPKAPAGKDANWVYTRRARTGSRGFASTVQRKQPRTKLENAGHRESELNAATVEHVHSSAYLNARRLPVMTGSNGSKGSL